MRAPHAEPSRPDPGGHPLANQEEKVLNIIRSAQALPTIPAVALSIIQMSREPDTTIEQLAGVMEKDPALAAKTLRFANSSYYGASKPIVSLSRALVRVGLRGARMLALSFGLVDACSKPCAGFDFGPFWLRSLTTAIAARRIAQRSLRKLADHAFVGALMADIGCPILARIFPEQYKTVAKHLQFSPKRLDEIERELLGISHPKVSSLLLGSWHLSPELVQAVSVHHDVSPMPRDSEAFPLAALILAASELADLVLRGGADQRIERLAAVFREFFSFSPEHVGLILQDIEPEIEKMGEMLEVSLPPVEMIQAGAKAEMLELALEKVSQDGGAAPDKG